MFISEPHATLPRRGCQSYASGCGSCPHRAVCRQNAAHVAHTVGRMMADWTAHLFRSVHGDATTAALVARLAGSLLHHDGMREGRISAFVKMRTAEGQSSVVAAISLRPDRRGHGALASYHRTLIQAVVRRLAPPASPAERG